MIGTIDCDAKKLITHWEKTAFDGTVTEWNKTLLVFKCLRRITDKHAITYQVLKFFINIKSPSWLKFSDTSHNFKNCFR